MRWWRPGAAGAQARVVVCACVLVVRVCVLWCLGVWHALVWAGRAPGV